jgi:tRNA-splicing ligase RtcB (3'-phosphate/5'-hydroxy nucleic acid ligase)
MIEPLVFKGGCAEARVFTVELEPEATKQIYGFLNCPAFEGAQIRIMPDCHAGAGAVIGFTAPVGDKIIPNVIGVDIGCGVVMARDNGAIEGFLESEGGFAAIDAAIRKNVPSGFKHREQPYNFIGEVFDKTIEAHHGVDLSEFWRDIEAIARKIDQPVAKIINQIGTLGGGNHFIELDRATDGTLGLTVHSGSRNFGLRVAQYHQQKAQDIMAGGNRRNDLAWLEGDDAREYLADMRVAQTFARLNRLVILDAIVSAMGSVVRHFERIEAVHNYIGDDNIIRKGAVSARKGEQVIIPWNMRDGLIVGVGLGNGEWNNSAPHGSGRRMSRGKARRTLDVGAFGESMESAGVWSSCVGVDTLDEAPEAYKPTAEILDAIGDTVKITDSYKPIYNFKSGKE